MTDYPTLRLAHLYPSLLNVAGDGGNVMAVVQRCAWRGIPTEVVDVEVGDTPDFSTFDMVFIQGGQDVEMQVAAADLGLKAPSLREAADQGVVVFAVCAGLQLLGKRYVPSAGEPMEGLALLDLETHGGPQRFMQHVAVEMTVDGATGTVVGFENHSGLTELGPGRPADRADDRRSRQQRARRDRGRGARPRVRHVPPRTRPAQEPLAGRSAHPRRPGAPHGRAGRAGAAR